MDESDIFLADARALATPLAEGDVRLALLADRHVEPLRQACRRDPDIWAIYPVNWYGDAFDAALEATAVAQRDRGWVRYAVLHRGEVVGITCYIGPDTVNRSVELGSTYINPRLARPA